jgi:hypothetical protein
VFAATFLVTSISSFAGYDPATVPTGVFDASETLEEYAIGHGGVRAGTAYGFSATFPGEPRHDVTTTDADGVELKIDLLTYESSADQAFQVAAVTYPAALDLSDPEGLLHAVARGSTGAIGDGKLSRYVPTTVGGDPAAGVLVSSSTGVFIRERLILHGRTLFQIQVISTTADPLGFGRFVDSFKVV